MKFANLLKKKEKKEEIPVSNAKQEVNRLLLEEKKSPEQILRENGIKIKLVTRTSFGIQIDFAKKYEHEIIEKLLASYTIKLKDKSVFIVE